MEQTITWAELEQLESKPLSQMVDVKSFYLLDFHLFRTKVRRLQEVAHLPEAALWLRDTFSLLAVVFPSLWKENENIFYVRPSSVMMCSHIRKFRSGKKNK
jgi:hypothetical protein